MRKSLINKKQHEEKFISEAVAEKTETVKEDLHKYVTRSAWPLFGEISPSYAEGSNLSKPLNVSMKEFEWNSIERHIKTLDVEKSKWIRYAIFKLIEEEQFLFFKDKN